MLLSIEKITKKFPVSRGFLGNPTAFLKAVDEVTFELDRGEILGVVGESGCGKSTLGRCAVGLYEPSAGTLSWEDERVANMDERRRRQAQRRFQMVFQNPFASLNPRQKVGEILSEPMIVHESISAKKRNDLATGFLNRVGLSSEDLQKYPHEFSGGQRQRIGLARALACQPHLIVLDEPVSSLDVSVQASILNLLAGLNRDEKLSYLFISHDLQVLGYLSHRVLVMYLGRVVEEGETKQVLSNPRHPYTQILLAASQGQKIAIAGEPPSPVQTPRGCPFHPRCPHAEERCRGEKQDLKETKKGWKVACWKWDQL
jgi:oligopeptide/dipeptide ABC transporter ATP-binding protein